MVAATRLHQAGRKVQVWLTADPARMPADAARARQEATTAGVPMQAMPATAEWPDGMMAIVDGLLGIGLNRAAGDSMAAWIGRLAAAPAPVFALDIPSGLFADTGAGDPAVRACRTLTFLGASPGCSRWTARLRRDH